MTRRAVRFDPFAWILDNLGVVLVLLAVAGILSQAVVHLNNRLTSVEQYNRARAIRSGLAIQNAMEFQRAMEHNSVDSGK
jgi:hypothetical protein